MAGFHGSPEPGHAYESPALAAAAKTWIPPGPQIQVGVEPPGTLFAYDPALDLVYFGTANAAPYDSRQIGPSNLDELYTASILAVKGRFGALAWHYQPTPHDHWDFDAVQKFVMADLLIDGKLRQTIMQANKMDSSMCWIASPASCCQRPTTPMSPGPPMSI